MKRLALLLALLAACSGEKAVTDTTPTDTREPIAIRYVGAPELNVREHPADNAAIVATYQNGEAISVLAEKGEWSEVRTGDRAGWAKSAELTTAEGKQESETNPTPKFKVMPMPISAPSAHGTIYIEADVNSDGDVIGVRLIQNTTGNDQLAEQNANALRSAKFYPIVIKGERKPFKYYHNVSY